MSLRSDVLSGLRWTAGVRLLSQIFTWAITLVVIRLLSPSDYGLLAMAMVFVGFLTMFADCGLASAIVQQHHIDNETLRKVFGVLLVISLSFTVALVLAAPVIATFFKEERLVLIVRVLAIQFTFAALAAIPDAMLQRRMEFRRRSLLDLSGAVAGSVATLALALAGEGVWALVAGPLLNQFWKMVGVNILAPFAEWPRFSVKGTRSLMTFGFHTMASQIAWFVSSQADVFIAGKWLGKELLGFYSVAIHIASLPNQRVAGIINQVAFPAFSRMQRDVRRVGENLVKAIRLLSFFAFPILWGISSVAPEAVNVILGAKWEPAVMPLQIVGLIMPIRVIGNFIPNAVQGVGRSDITLLNSIWALFVIPIAFLIGVHWGLLGLSLAWLVASPLVFAQNMIRSLPAVGLKLSRLAGSMLPATCAGLVMYAGVTATRLLWPTGQSVLLRLGVMVALGAVLYVIASLAINRIAVRESLELFREFAVLRRSDAATD